MGSSYLTSCATGTSIYPKDQRSVEAVFNTPNLYISEIRHPPKMSQSRVGELGLLAKNNNNVSRRSNIECVEMAK